MKRITDPLCEMGAQLDYNPAGAEKGFLPVTITGAQPPLQIRYEMAVASAQIKSAILFAALNARGQTIITEPHLSRDHSEAMLSHFGVALERKCQQMAATESLKARQNYKQKILLCRATFFCRLCDGCRTDCKEQPYHPTRHQPEPATHRLYYYITGNGGNIEIVNECIEGGEAVAIYRSVRRLSIAVLQHDQLHDDEYPILSAAAACADGETYMPGGRNYG